MPRRAPTAEQDQHPEAAPDVSLTPERLQTVLATSTVFEGLSPQALGYLASNLRQLALPAGTVLVRQGDIGTSAYIVTSGRLRASIAGGGRRKRERVVGEVMPGEVVGEMSLIADEPRSATIRAARDSMLVLLERKRFEELTRAHPEAMQAVLRTVVKRLRSALHGDDRAGNMVHALAILPAGEGVDLAAFADDLARAFSKIGPTQVLSRARMVADLGMPTDVTLLAENTTANELSEAWRGGHFSSTMDGLRATISEAEMSDWLQRVESDHRFVLYQGESRATSWTMRCLRQADRVLMVGRASGDHSRSEVEDAMQRFEQASGEDSLERDKHLVLLQDATCPQPTGTHEWLAQRRVARHHHVRMGNTNDYERVARLLAGRATLLTLGGGGARGLAHIGVFKALQECNVPIDAIAGTSAGALVGAAPAFDWSLAEIRERIANRLVTTSSPLDYTAPVTALIKGQRIAQRIRDTYGDGNIEDTWLPFFCISCNITRGAQVAHRRGSLWRALRASISIPGVLPPVRTHDGDVLVDGGLINNLPVEMQQQDWPGSDVIASSLRGEVTIAADDLPDDGVLSGWPSVAGRLNPLRRGNRRVPSLAEVILRSTDTGSTLSTRQSEARASLLLRPPVRSYALLDFSHMAAMEEAAYRHTMEMLPEWLAARKEAAAS